MNSWRNIRWRCINEAARWLLKRGLFWWPDSSRYFYAEGYEDRLARGEEQRQLSKEFVRQWLIQNGFQGKEGQQVPEMTEEYCNSVSDRYIELYEHIVGEKFVKAEGEDVAARIEKHVTDFLNNRKK